MHTVRTMYTVLWSGAALLALIYLGGVLSAGTRTAPELPAPTVLVGCSTIGCPTTPRYTTGQTVCIVWNGHPCR